MLINKLIHEYRSLRISDQIGLTYVVCVVKVTIRHFVIFFLPYIQGVYVRDITDHQLSIVEYQQQSCKIFELNYTVSIVM